MSSRESRLQALLAQAGNWQTAGNTWRSVNLAGARPETAAPLYMIPDRIIDALVYRIREFFSDEELALERRFTSLCQAFNAIGVLHGQFVHHAHFSRPEPLDLTDGLIRELGWEQYATPESIRQQLGLAQKLAEPVFERLEAYLGWLMTNAYFLGELANLRTQWQGRLENVGAVPAFPTVTNINGGNSAFETNDADPNPMVAAFVAFYKRWQLKRLATWDLPEPIGANIGGPGVVGQFVGVETEPTVQLPQTVRLPVRFPLRSAVGGQPENHLADWQDVMNQSHPCNLSYTRWARLMRLHFLRNVVLASGYEGRFRRRAGALDWVFADYFGDDSQESVRQLRLKVDRRLNRGTRHATRNS